MFLRGAFVQLLHATNHALKTVSAGVSTRQEEAAMEPCGCSAPDLRQAIRSIAKMQGNGPYPHAA